MIKTLTRFAVSATLSGAATFAAFSVPFMPATAHAAETTSVRVSYADLNLSSKAGLLTLERRLRTAATRVCGTAPMRDLHEISAHRACMNQALDVESRKMASRKVTARQG
ncbi:UrcA family protein [Sphingomonas sp. ID0503]|uniref:UrcA family protein n=1 Tax=Sphingomonas sp. ID0503 TaxID=3399691 RepID=UPI003AFA9468